MSEQQQQKKTSPILDAIRHLHDATRELLIERDDWKARFEDSNHQHQLAERRAAIAESEAGQLREQLDRMTSERDGYFQDASALRASLINAGNMIVESATSTTQRQAFSPSSVPATQSNTPTEEGRRLPRFLRDGPRDIDELRRKPPVDLNELAAAIG